MVSGHVLLVLLLAFIYGCGGEEPFRKATSPVKGKVTVDGQSPGSEIQIECHSVNGMDTDHPTVSQTSADADGVFSISTCSSGDGVPAGDYVLTCSWQDFNLMTRGYSGPDKVNGRYSDSKTSPIRITVKDGEPLDLGTVELTTK